MVITAAKNLVKNSLAQRPLNSSTEIRITHLCTQRCRQCQVYERTTEPPSMSLETFRQIGERLKAYGAWIGFISGGEATLVPHLDQILIESKKIFPLATTLVTGLYNRTEVIEKFGRVALENNINIQTSFDGLGELGDKLRGAKNFAETVMKHMQLLSRLRGESKSMLYANIVISNLNLDQVPELIRTVRDLGWQATVGMYHSLTATTRFDQEMKLVPGARLDRLVQFLLDNPDILNLNAFIRGIPEFVARGQSDFCAFTDSPVLATRLTIMEDANVHLCWGDPVGNLLEQDLASILTGAAYHQRLAQYRTCSGCWTTCYTQRYLLTHPRSLADLKHNLRKVIGLKSARKA